MRRGNARAGLHPHLDSANLLPLLNEPCGEPRPQLPELDRDRAAIGVDDDLAPLEIGDVRSRRQVDRQHRVEECLKPTQAFCLIGKPGKVLAGGEMVCQ